MPGRLGVRFASLARLQHGWHRPRGPGGRVEAGGSHPGGGGRTGRSQGGRDQGGPRFAGAAHQELQGA
eukprot:11768918-Alexandrium_andersonii.AAC.1